MDGASSISRAIDRMETFQALASLTVIHAIQEVIS
jgi:hypothetical protein